MAAPTYTQGGPGSLLTQTGLGASKNMGVFLDASIIFEAQVTCKEFTGATTPSATSGVKFEAYHVYGATALTNGGAAGQTSVTVGSATGIQVGQPIAIGSGPTGEVRTVSAVAGSTLTINATQYAHGTTDPVYLIEQTPTASVQPGPASGSTYAVSTVYSKTLYLQTSQYFVLATNLDATSATYTVEMDVDKITTVT